MAIGWRHMIWAAGLMPAIAWAEEVPLPNPHPELVRTYYDYGVVEYCRLVDMPSHNGFALLRSDQIARGKIGREADRQARIDANMAVDLEYQNRGLGGQKNWCKKEGILALERFTQYFRTRQLP